MGYIAMVTLYVKATRAASSLLQGKRQLFEVQ